MVSKTEARKLAAEAKKLAAEEAKKAAESAANEGLITLESLAELRLDVIQNLMTEAEKKKVAGIEKRNNTIVLCQSYGFYLQIYRHKSTDETDNGEYYEFTSIKFTDEGERIKLYCGTVNAENIPVQQNGDSGTYSVKTPDSIDKLDNQTVLVMSKVFRLLENKTIRFGIDTQTLVQSATNLLADEITLRKMAKKNPKLAAFFKDERVAAWLSRNELRAENKREERKSLVTWAEKRHQAMSK